MLRTFFSTMLFLLYFSKVSLADICFLKNGQKFDGLYQLQNEKVTEITIEMKNARSFILDIMKIMADKNISITKKNKKKHKVKIILNFKSFDCVFDARIRMTGDYKDHIYLNKNKIISSLKVEMKNFGNINSFTEFKLFNPITRYGENEIIHTTLLRMLNFLAPRSSFINVNFSGHKFRMILQEGMAKE